MKFFNLIKATYKKNVVTYNNSDLLFPTILGWLCGSSAVFPQARLCGCIEVGDQGGLTHALEDGPGCGLWCLIFLHAASAPSGLDWVPYMVFSIPRGRKPQGFLRVGLQSSSAALGW